MCFSIRCWFICSTALLLLVDIVLVGVVLLVVVLVVVVLVVVVLVGVLLFGVLLVGILLLGILLLGILLAPCAHLLALHVIVDFSSFVSGIQLMSTGAGM